MKPPALFRRIVDQLRARLKHARRRAEGDLAGESQEAELELRAGPLALPQDAQLEPIESSPAAGPVGTSRRSPLRDALLERLRDPRGLREAIVINEILQKPLALRRRWPLALQRRR